MDNKRKKRNWVITGYALGVLLALFYANFALTTVDNNLYNPPTGSNKYNRISDIESSFIQGDLAKTSKMISNNLKILKEANGLAQFVRRSALAKHTAENNKLKERLTSTVKERVLGLVRKNDIDSAVKLMQGLGVYPNLVKTLSKITVDLQTYDFKSAEASITGLNSGEEWMKNLSDPLTQYVRKEKEIKDKLDGFKEKISGIYMKIASCVKEGNIVLAESEVVNALKDPDISKNPSFAVLMEAFNALREKDFEAARKSVDDLNAREQELKLTSGNLKNFITLEQERIKKKRLSVLAKISEHVRRGKYIQAETELREVQQDADIGKDPAFAAVAEYLKAIKERNFTDAEKSAGKLNSNDPELKPFSDDLLLVINKECAIIKVKRQNVIKKIADDVNTGNYSSAETEIQAVLKDADIGRDPVFPAVSEFLKAIKGKDLMAAERSAGKLNSNDLELKPLSDELRLVINEEFGDIKEKRKNVLKKIAADVGKGNYNSAETEIKSVQKDVHIGRDPAFAAALETLKNIKSEDFDAAIKSVASMDSDNQDLTPLFNAFLKSIRKESATSAMKEQIKIIDAIAADLKSGNMDGALKNLKLSALDDKTGKHPVFVMMTGCMDRLTNNDFAEAEKIAAQIENEVGAAPGFNNVLYKDSISSKSKNPDQTSSVTDIRGSVRNFIDIRKKSNLKNQKTIADKVQTMVKENKSNLPNDFTFEGRILIWDFMTDSIYPPYYEQIKPAIRGDSFDAVTMFCILGREKRIKYVRSEKLTYTALTIAVIDVKLMAFLGKKTVDEDKFIDWIESTSIKLRP